MSAVTVIGIAAVVAVGCAIIGYVVGLHRAEAKWQDAADLVNILREGLAAAHKLNEEQFTARYEAGITDALAAVRGTRSEAGRKAAVTRAMRRQVGEMVAQVEDAA